MMPSGQRGVDDGKWPAPIILSGIGSNGILVSAYPVDRKGEAMKTIKIQLDFLQGPIWTSDSETGRPQTGIEAVDNDERLRELNYEIQDLFDSYYEFDSHGEACWFDGERERADKERMLGLISRLVARLDEINDGSFAVEDLETPRLERL